MGRLLLVLILVAFVGTAVTPMVTSFLGFPPASAYAGPKKGPVVVVDDDQGEDNDDQGENEQ